MLSLYTKTPNTDNGLHYVFNNVTKYVTWLGEPYCTLTDVSFDITNGIVRIDTNGTFLSKSTAYITATRPLANVTYIMHTQQDGEQRFYHVLSTEYVSGMYILYVALDVWATYMTRISVSAVVERSNVNFDNQYRLDDIKMYKSTTPVVDNTVFIDNLFTRTNGKIDFDTQMCVVVKVLVNSGVSSVFSNNTLYQTQILAAEVGDIKGLDDGTVTTYTLKMQAFYDRCGTITAIEESSNGTDWHKTEDVTVTEAWVVPKSLLTLRSTGTYNRLVSTEGGDFRLQTFYAVEPQILNKVVDYSTLHNTTFANKDFYFGSYGKSIKLKRSGDTTFVIRVLVDNGNIEIHAIQGETDVDMTSLFSVPFTANDGNLSTLEKIKNIIAATSGFASAVGAAVGGNYVGGVTGVASTVANMFSEGNGRYINGGTAPVVFQQENENYIFMGIIENTSLYDEIAIANNSGAFVGAFEIDNLGQLANYNTFVGGITNVQYKYIKTIDETITNVTNDVAQAFSRALRNGVKIMIL